MRIELVRVRLGIMVFHPFRKEREKHGAPGGRLNHWADAAPLAIRLHYKVPRHLGWQLSGRFEDEIDENDRIVGSSFFCCIHGGSADAL